MKRKEEIMRNVKFVLLLFQAGDDDQAIELLLHTADVLKKEVIQVGDIK
jgi:hypothetical protein